MKKFRGIFIKNEHEIELMRVANGMTATILDELVANVRPGVPTIFFDELARKMCRDMGVVPNFLNYFCAVLFRQRDHHSRFSFKGHHFEGRGHCQF